MRKTILVFSHALEIGGAERALLGLLESFDYSKYEVDLFLMRHVGELFCNIPVQVNLLPMIKEYSGLAVPMVSLVKKGLLNVAFGRLKAKVKAKSFTKIHHIKGDNAIELEYSHKYTKKYMPMVNDKEYDLAISFLTPHYFVAEKVHAKKKIAWIHTDYSYIDVDVDSELHMWRQYDYIASISEDCTKGFGSKFPSLKDNILLIENIASVEFIRKQAEKNGMKPVFNETKSVKLLSIGRFCHQKNFDNVPDICRKVIAEGIDVKWFLIGFGSDEELIKSKIKENRMEKHVFLIGKTDNPYPYIKNCDLYVQPSRYEGKAVTVREAQILNKPIAITNYPTSSSQLVDGFDGIIVPMDNEGCAKALADVIRDKDLQQKLVNNTRKTDYSNANEIEKLYSVIG